jgi:hypothetical protein
METWFASKEQREDAIAALRAMPKQTRRLLEQAVEHQELTRHELSESARQLESKGLIFCREGEVWEPWIITPSLWGEEALHRLEIRERKERRAQHS